MTQSFATTAAFRFGLGFAPGVSDVANVEELVAQVKGPDTAVNGSPASTLAERVKMQRRFQELKRARKNKKPDFDRQEFAKVRNMRREVRWNDAVRLFKRGVGSPASFRERLAFFWTDHFTVAPKSAVGYQIWGDHIEQGIP